MTTVIRRNPLDPISVCIDADSYVTFRTDVESCGVTGEELEEVLAKWWNGIVRIYGYVNAMEVRRFLGLNLTLVDRLRMEWHWFRSPGHDRFLELSWLRTSSHPNCRARP